MTYIDIRLISYLDIRLISLIIFNNGGRVIHFKLALGMLTAACNVYSIIHATTYLCASA